MLLAVRLQHGRDINCRYTILPACVRKFLRSIHLLVKLLQVSHSHRY